MPREFPVLAITVMLRRQNCSEKSLIIPANYSHLEAMLFFRTGMNHSQTRVNADVKAVAGKERRHNNL